MSCDYCIKKLEAVTDHACSIKLIRQPHCMQHAIGKASLLNPSSQKITYASQTYEIILLIKNTHSIVKHTHTQNKAMQQRLWWGEPSIFFSSIFYKNKYYYMCWPCLSNCLLADIFWNLFATLADTLFSVLRTLVMVWCRENRYINRGPRFKSRNFIERIQCQSSSSYICKIVIIKVTVLIGQSVDIVSIKQ